MHMKRWLIALLAAAVLTSCAQASIPNTERSQAKMAQNSGQWAEVELCFLSSDVGNSDRLVEKEIRQIKLEPQKSLEQSVLEELFRGPTTPKSKNIIPKDSQVLKIEKQDNTLLVVLNEHANTLSPVDEAMMKDMIVLTMTKLEGIDAVGVYFGEIETDSKNNPIGVVFEEDIVSEDITSKIGEKTISIYLPNLEKSALVQREITIQTSINESIEKTAIDELFKNQLYPGFSPTMFNPNAKLVSSFVEGDTFFLNFSEVIIKEQTSYEDAYLSLYSLVSTISDLQPIKHIKILIKGKADNVYGELFKEPFYIKNEEIIIQQ